MKYLSVGFLILVLLCGASLAYFYLIHKSTSENNSHKQKQQIVVTIQGAIKKPGTYNLEIGSKFIDLLQASGGLEEYAEIENLNFDEQLRNNNNYEVGINLSLIKKVNLNALRTPQELQDIVKTYTISNALAKAIIDELNKYGSFQRSEQINSIYGIGEVTLTELKNYFFLA